MRQDPDEALLAELADLLGRVAGPPPELTRQARALYTWRTVDAELAELVHDSAADAATAGVRSGQQPRTLTFEVHPPSSAGPDRTPLLIEVELDETVGARQLIGQLVPPGPATLEL